MVAVMASICAAAGQKSRSRRGDHCSFPDLIGCGLPLGTDWPHEAARQSGFSRSNRSITYCAAHRGQAGPQALRKMHRLNASDLAAGKSENPPIFTGSRGSRGELLRVSALSNISPEGTNLPAEHIRAFITKACAPAE